MNWQDPARKEAVKAIEEGRFKDEIIPIVIPNKKGDVVIDTDEYPKKDVTLEGLARLKPTFKDDGTVTPGNASGMNDGASGVILMAEEKAMELGVPVLARILGVATYRR